MNVKGKNIAVLGAGVEGISSAKYLHRQGANVTLLDKNDSSARIEGVPMVTGASYLSNLSSFDMIVRSPGFKRNLPELLEAEKQGVHITSQTILFFTACPAPIIGVTGTKGKGTTSSLIYEMIKAEGLDVYLGGNIGLPPLEFIDKVQPTSWVVLELSSFQLEDLQKSPHIGVMLMIVPEHLGKDAVGTQNFHEDFETYIDAKRNIVRWQTPEDFAVLNKDYLPTNESDIHTDARVFYVTTENEVEEGCFIRQGRLLIRRDGKEQELMNIADVQLPGRHNQENVCAATMTASLAGISKKSIVQVLKTFKGLEHRLELVREVNGVLYYDDSFSTTPETAIAAIEAFDAPEILILGGSTKGSDFTELGKVISERVNIKAVLGIGDEWASIKRTITNKDIPLFEGFTSINDVVKKASEVASTDDVVLLSPACASFGMFKNYKERGNLFKEAVRSLLN